MTERQRTAQHATATDPANSAETGKLGEIRTLADQLMANAEDSMRRLGLNSPDAYLNATRQSGGQ